MNGKNLYYGCIEQKLALKTYTRFSAAKIGPVATGRNAVLIEFLSGVVIISTH